MDLFSLLLLYSIGCVGWMLFRKLKITSPALLGSLTFVGILRALGLEFVTSPRWFTMVTHIFLGIYMGSTLTKETMSQMKQILRPAVFVIVWAILATFFGGVILAILTSLDLKTAILASSTGGITEMVVLAVEVKADTLQVVILQTFRVIVSMSLYPLAMKALLKRQPRVVKSEFTETIDQSKSKHWGKSVASLIFATSGALLFSALKIPAGAMIGSLVFMVLANMLGFGKKVGSQKMLGFLLVAVGIGVADSITPSTAQALFSVSTFYTLLITLFLSFLSSVLITVIVQRLTKWDWATCILACAPAGVSSMPILAIEANLDPLPISLLQLCRSFTVKACVPLMGALFI